MEIYRLFFDRDEEKCRLFGKRHTRTHEKLICYACVFDRCRRTFTNNFSISSFYLSCCSECGRYNCFDVNEIIHKNRWWLSVYAILCKCEMQMNFKLNYNLTEAELSCESRKCLSVCTTVMCNTMLCLRFSFALYPLAAQWYAHPVVYCL